MFLNVFLYVALTQKQNPSENPIGKCGQRRFGDTPGQYLQIMYLHTDFEIFSFLFYRCSSSTLLWPETMHVLFITKV